MATNKSLALVIQEIEFWFRLATFLHEPLKYALLSILHNTTNDSTYIGLPEDPYQLYQEFSKHKNLIAQLVKKKVLQQDQVDLLLPPNDNKTDSTKFDVTLIAILIINFTSLQPPLNGWKKNLLSHDRSKGAGVIRAKDWRDYIHHTDPKDVSQGEFNQKWKEATQIITELEYQYDVNKLKTISLDPKHEVVLNSIFSFIKYLKTKHNSLELKHDLLEAKHDSLESKTRSRLISSLTQQCNKIANEVQHLQLDEEIRKDQSNTKKSSSRCLKSVLEYISKEIKEEEVEELLDQLTLPADGDLVDLLKPVPWNDIRNELEMLGRKDIVDHIRKNTLITRGLQNASDKLRKHYINELIQCLTEQPLFSVEMDSPYSLREGVYTDLVILPSSTVDQEFNNSDRDFLMKQTLLEKSLREKSVDKIIKPHDELIFIRGVAGIGKSTLMDMFTLKWAKKELNNSPMFDFVFKFTCRELNQILNEFETLDELLKLQYPEVFCNLTLEDLAEVSDRVLIIVDGLDELKDIYQMDGMNASSIPQAPFLQIICDLINPKSFKSLKAHKTVVCGRPKACDFVKSQFITFNGFNIKTIEVCGFDCKTVQKYILSFFDKDERTAKVVQDTIAGAITK